MKRYVDFIGGVPLVKLFSLFASKKKSEKQPQKILIIKLAAMGDTVILIPVLRNLREKLPHAEIHWLVSNVNVALAETVPYVNELHVWSPVSSKTFPAILSELKNEKFDTVVDLEQWARVTPLISYLIGAERRIGFDTPGQHRADLYTDPIPKSPDQHEIKDFYRAVSKVVDLPEDLRLELFETEKGKEQVSHLAPKMVPQAGRPMIVLHPGCGEDGLPREWPIEQYALLGNWLIHTYKARLILTGGPEEKYKTNRLGRLLNHQVLDLGGRLSWQGTVSLIKKVDGVISGNTGVMHIAAALGKHQVTLHGPTDPKIWGPLNEKAIVIQSPCPGCPCLKLGFEYHKTDQSCMAQIDLSEVKKAVSSFLGNS